MTRQLLAAGVALALSSVGMGRAQAAPREGAPPEAGICPMKLPGAVASAADWPGGAMLTFETSSSKSLPELRKRVHQWAQQFETHVARLDPGQGVGGAGTAGQAPGPTKPGPAARSGPVGQLGKAAVVSLPRAWVSVDDTKRGSRILFTPEQGSQLTELRGAVQQYAKHLVIGGCPILEPAPGTPSAAAEPPAP